MSGPPLLEVDDRAIRALHDLWMRAETAGDVDLILGLCAPDVCWITDTADVRLGHEAGRELLTGGVPLLDLQTEITSLYGTRDIAYKTCRFEARHRMADGALHCTRGTHLWILHCQAAGWRVSLVTWELEKLT
jgi:ketosteroid isomerase-like protein